MIKKLTIYCSLLLAFLFNGCAQDDWLINPDGAAPDRDYTEIEFAVSETRHVKTRAYSLNDGDLDKVTILLYSAAEATADCRLLQSEEFGASDLTSKRVRIEYNDKVKEYFKGKSNIYLFAVANHDVVGNCATLADLYKIKDNTDPKNLTHVVMTGHAGDSGEDDPVVTTVSKSALNSTVTVTLRRNIARAQVGVGDEAKGVFELSEYNIWSAAPAGYVAAGVSKSADATGFALGSTGTINGEAQTPGTATAPNFVYGYPQPVPTQNVDNPEKDNRAFVIVKGRYMSEECYYRIDLRRPVKDSEGKKTGRYEYLFLTANHQYDITITKVKCKGYATAEEAAKHPQVDFMEVDIHDHVPAVLSMTSDGVRELGVEKDMTSESSPAYFTMKLFSHVSSNEYPAEIADIRNSPYYDKEQGIYDDGNGFSIRVVEGKEWMKLKDLSLVSGQKVEDGESVSDEGNVYKVGLDFVSAYATGSQTGKLLVSWRGLSREVNVTWENNFNPDDICSASLSIKYNGNKTVNTGSAGNINDYWTFLKAQLEGASKSQNNGKVRNEGLHFPLWYGGDDGRNWIYEYTLTINPSLLSKFSDKTISARVEANGNALEAWPAGGITYDQNNHTIKISANSKSFQKGYLTGKLVISIGGEDLPGIDIYRTGFFHLVPGSSSADSPLQHEVSGTVNPAGGWYYYEVRNFGGRLWLDRNICATSGGMEIRTNTGASLVPSGTGPFNEGACGGYFRPAKPVDYDDVEDNIYETICPPGFRIPNTSEWDLIRNDISFDLNQTVAGGVTYNKAEVMDDNGNMIYLPKVLYYNTQTELNNRGTLVGDSRAGYYWTKSEAHGLEKNQIGHWMSALFISGASNSYMHGNVGRYGMQVRAIDDWEETVKQTTIGFTVVGATHVYIYDAGEPYSSTDKDDKNYTDMIKSGLMSWPGVAIGEWKTMRAKKSGNSYINPEDGDNAAREFTFNYTVNTDKRNLRFVFAYVKDGKITVFCRKRHTDGSGVGQYEGWPLLSSYKFGLDDYNSTTFDKTLDGNVIDPTGSQKTYLYFIKDWPNNSNDKPLGVQVGVKTTNSNAYTNFVDANWGGEKLTRTETFNGDTYYVVEYVTDQEDFRSQYAFRYWHNSGNKVTYGSSTEFTYKNFKWDEEREAYCVTINDLNTDCVPGDPDGSNSGGGGGDDGDAVIIYGDYNIVYSGDRTHIYHWNESSSDKMDWNAAPEMEKVTGSDGKEYKVWKVDEGTTHIIFKNDGQTGNLKYEGSGYIYDDNGKTDKKVVIKPASNARRKMARTGSSAGKKAASKTPTRKR